MAVLEGSGEFWSSAKELSQHCYHQCMVLKYRLKHSLLSGCFMERIIEGTERRQKGHENELRVAGKRGPGVGRSRALYPHPPRILLHLYFHRLLECTSYNKDFDLYFLNCFFNANPIKIQIPLFAEIRKIHPKILLESQRTQIVKTILKKDKTGGLTRSDFKSSFKATVMKTVGYGIQADIQKINKPDYKVQKYIFVYEVNLQLFSGKE
jgi:hypothetical protein